MSSVSPQDPEVTFEESDVLFENLSSTSEKDDKSTSGECQCALSVDLYNYIVRKFMLEAYEPELPETTQTVYDAPKGKIGVYASFFLYGNLRFPLKKFVYRVLEKHGVHLTEVHPMAIAKARHFEWVCRILDIEPRVDRLISFYTWRCIQGWYTLVTRIKGLKICATERTLRSWKREFFYISARVMPIAMTFKNGGALPNLPASTHQETEWFTKISQIQTPVYRFPESGMVMLGMSRVWKDAGSGVPQIPILLEYGLNYTPYGTLHLLCCFRVFLLTLLSTLFQREMICRRCCIRGRLVVRRGWVLVTLMKTSCPFWRRLRISS
ncbi:uncharacterized protein LOC143623685 [Bidens hawaiensis]|uniref:uncharacterized protein LOC143623685 n=1 Tax=Bidens hawaiensis TaxID=980011 RepID=UPI00404A9C5B